MTYGLPDCTFRANPLRKGLMNRRKMWSLPLALGIVACGVEGMDDESPMAESEYVDEGNPEFASTAQAASIPAG